MHPQPMRIQLHLCICHATARRPPFPVNYLRWFPSELRGKAVPLTESLYSVEYHSGSQSEIIEHRPLVTWQSLSQSEAFPPFSPERFNVIPSKPYKKRCKCTSGSVLKFHSWCTLRTCLSQQHSD